MVEFTLGPHMFWDLIKHLQYEYSIQYSHYFLLSPNDEQQSRRDKLITDVIIYTVGTWESEVQVKMPGVYSEYARKLGR